MKDCLLPSLALLLWGKAGWKMMMRLTHSRTKGECHMRRRRGGVLSEATTPAL